MKQAIFSVLAIAAIGGGWWFWTSHSGKNSQGVVVYRTMPLERGSVSNTIRATGTVEPEDLIDVGAQIAGQILAFGKDTAGKEVDYCSVVREGELLARIDDVTYKAELKAARASESSAKASLIRAKADLEQAKAKFRQAERDWKRAETLGVGDALAQSVYDSYLSAYEVAKAAIAVSEAAINEAEAAIAQSEAQVEKAERNLSYCDILAPVDGVIIDRRVNIGQTVVASMSAPSLFLIAKDLRKIQVWVAVNEADIGSVKTGMPVTFTVDAFPGRTFTGKVEKVRLNASMTQNVVTYTVEIATANDDSLLLPYLTANVQFLIAEEKDAWVVPSGALRWRPEGFTGARGGHIFTIGPDGKPQAVAVKTGTTDGTTTAISGDGLKEGLQIITGVATAEEIAAAGKQNGANPFIPQMPRPGGQRRGGPPM